MDKPLATLLAVLLLFGLACLFPDTATTILVGVMLAVCGGGILLMIYAMAYRFWNGDH